MYETVATNTEYQNDIDVYSQLLKDNLIRTTEALKENQILINGFRSIGINFLQLLKEEERFIFKKHTRR